MYRYWIVFYIVFFTTPVFAVEVTDLYVAKVPVLNKTERIRNQALKAAFNAVVIKVGGKKANVALPAIKKAAKQYNSYVRQYAYINTSGQNELLVTFDESKINRLFVENNLSIWGRLRPNVLLWLVYEDGLARNLIGESSSSNIPTIVQGYSQNRGLPIIMPLIDLTDAANVTTSDIWGRFEYPIKQASKRYMAESVVIIRVSNSSLLPDSAPVDCQLLCQEQLALDWSFIGDVNRDTTQIFGERYQGTNVSELLPLALEDITENIYQQYAHSTSTNNDFVIDVANVSSISTYVKITEFLQNLASVQSVQLTHATGTKRRFKLTLIGSEQSLLASLRLSKQIRQYIDPLAQQSEDDIPMFYWGQQ